MRKVVSLLAALMLLAVAAFCLPACKKKKGNLKDEVYTVSFSTAYLSSSAFAPESVKVKRGNTLSKPTETYDAKAGYEVVWVRDALNPSAYAFSSPVTESFTLYAVEMPKDYKIIYLLEMGSNSSANPATYRRTSDFTFAKANAPFGYRFLKWSYYDDPESTVLRIEPGSEGDLVLRGVFEPVRYAVLYFGLEDAENPNESSYLFGEEMTLTSPRREGFRFLGFTINGQAGSDYVSALTPSFVEENQKALFKTNGSDIALRANWERIS